MLWQWFCFALFCFVLFSSVWFNFALFCFCCFFWADYFGDRFWLAFRFSNVYYFIKMMMMMIIQEKKLKSISLKSFLNNYWDSLFFPSSLSFFLSFYLPLKLLLVTNPLLEINQLKIASCFRSKRYWLFMKKRAFLFDQNISNCKCLWTTCWKWIIVLVYVSDSLIKWVNDKASKRCGLFLLLILLLLLLILY